jgi:hypothetical protein
MDLPSRSGFRPASQVGSLILRGYLRSVSLSHTFFDVSDKGPVFRPLYIVSKSRPFFENEASARSVPGG